MSNLKANNAIDDALKVLKPIVQQIEAMPPTTKGHYAEYLVLLSRFQEKKETVAKLLILAGANIEGVDYALTLA